MRHFINEAYRNQVIFCSQNGREEGFRYNHFIDSRWPSECGVLRRDEWFVGENDNASFVVGSIVDVGQFELGR